MKIKSFSTEQFAGIRTDKPITFADGMNVVLGNNETGKSTMISAINYALNKPVKLDHRTDKEFIAAVFPIGGEDTVDATVRVQDGGQCYTVKKVWDRAGGAAEVSFKPENSGLLRGGKAEKALKETVRFGEGVYNNLIFGRQNNEKQILDWCYDFFSSKANDDVTETKKKIAEAFSAAGGISPDKFLNLINGYLEGDSKRNIKGLGGNWDFDRDQPKKHTKNKRWEKGNGSILEAYYAYEDAKVERDSAVETEKEIADKTEEIASLLKEKYELESKREELAKQFGAVSDRNNIEALCTEAEKKRRAAQEAISLWPKAEETLAILDQLKAAKEEKERRESKNELCGLIGQIKELEEENQKIQEELERADSYKKDESDAKALSDRIRTIHGMLTAAKLRAVVEMEPGYKAVMLSADGTEREIGESKTVDANGFVRLSIPGVASVQVYPQELDLEGLEEEKKDKEIKLSELLKKYDSDTLEAFIGKCREFDRKELTRRGNLRVISGLLKGKTVDEYEVERDGIVINESVSIPDSLEEDIRKLLNEYEKSSLEELKGSLGETISGYKREYETLDKLPEKYNEAVEQEDEYSKRLQKYADTSCLSLEQYKEREKGLKDRIKTIDEEVGEKRTEIGGLSAGEITDIEGLEAKVKDAEGRWIHEKRKYEYYVRIKQDFAALRSQETDQFGEFYNKFNEYLGMITDGRISLNLAGDGLGLRSGSLKVDSGNLLSEGTKKTVLLAFRLAVLEYFFPEGDGLVVLDDDLLDMDPARRQQAAKLLKRFAESNQVIFTTCDPAVAELLGGNMIPM